MGHMRAEMQSPSASKLESDARARRARRPRGERGETPVPHGPLHPFLRVFSRSFSRPRGLACLASRDDREGTQSKQPPPWSWFAVRRPTKGSAMAQELLGLLAAAVQTGDRQSRASASVQLTSAHLQDAFFSSLPPTLRAEVASSLTGGTFGANELVFLEGTLGEHFYIVIEGSVRILQNHLRPDVSPGSGTERVRSHASETLIVELKAGSSFGELSILGSSDSERRRAASAVAGKDGAVLGVLGRDDYLRLLQKEQKRQLHECVTQLRSVRPFRDVPTLSLTRMAVLMRKNQASFSRGEIILGQGEAPTRLFVLTSGDVLIKASAGSIPPNEEADGRAKSAAAHGGQQKQIELVLLACGAGGQAELVGESCCCVKVADRVSLVTFVAQSARVNGYYLDVDDVARLTGGGVSRFSRIVAAGSGGGYPIQRALQEHAVERAAQFHHRLTRIVHLIHLTPAGYSALTKQPTGSGSSRTRRAAPPATRPHTSPRVRKAAPPPPNVILTMKRYPHRPGKMDRRPRATCIRAVNGLPIDLSRTRICPDMRQNKTSARSPRTANIDSARFRQIQVRDSAPTCPSESGPTHCIAQQCPFKGAHCDIDEEWCEDNIKPVRCPSLLSWVDEVSYTPRTPESSRRQGPLRMNVTPRQKKDCPVQPEANGPFRSATRVRITAQGTFSVPRLAAP